MITFISIKIMMASIMMRMSFIVMMMMIAIRSKITAQDVIPLGSRKNPSNTDKAFPSQLADLSITNGYDIARNTKSDI